MTNPFYAFLTCQGIQRTVRKRWEKGVPLLFLALAACSGPPQPIAEVVFENGNIYTMTDPDTEGPDARVVAVSEGKILYVGEEEGLEPFVDDSTIRVDLEENYVLPGFIEGHGHLLSLGLNRLELDATGTGSAEEIADQVRERASGLAKGQWILGRGWDQNDWAKKTFPSAEILTRAAPENPVFLRRIDGHAAWANQAAMEQAGITRETPDPEGGRILRQAEGHPTGIFIDRAMALVQKVIPPRSREEKEKAIELAIQECHRYGITSFQDAGVGSEIIEIYKDMLREERLPLNLYVMIAGSDEELLDRTLARGPLVDPDGQGITIRSIKLSADGALGSRGAALLEDYTDEPGHRGLLILDEETVYRVAKRAVENRFQVCTHAIGDRANHEVLNAYERALREFDRESMIVKRKPRFRIEHAQILDASDIPRFAELGILPSMQGTHCTSDMPWVPDRIGAKRAEEGAYVWRKLRELGLPLINGSDAPVESVNPLLGIYASVTRTDPQGTPEGGWYPEQRMTRKEALASYTIWAAFGAFEERVKGTLEVGKLADMVVLDRDLHTIPAPEILQTRVVMTILGGEPVYFPGLTKALEPLLD